VSVQRFKLTIAFDGTAYHGWHAGRSGRGVADHIEKALAVLFPSAPSLVSSSRTDSGVHALGMAAHFDIAETDSAMPARRLLPALNALLPPNIRILTAARTCPSFHARFSATSKQYRYHVWNAPVMNPLLHGRAWHVPQELDLKAMRKAASLLCGRHDFRAFTSRRDGELAESCRTLTRITIRKSGPLLTIIIQGDGFLYKMCRGIVGTLVKTGRGMMTSSMVEQLLSEPSAHVGRLNAPACGLILWKVCYSRKNDSPAPG